MKSVYIYALLDPVTDEICYVGKTTNIKRRIYQHLWKGLPSSRCLEVSIWSNRICDMNRVNHKVLEECEKKNSKAREVYWIRRMWKEGNPLLNMSGHLDLIQTGFSERIKSTAWYAEYYSKNNQILKKEKNDNDKEK